MKRAFAFLAQTNSMGSWVVRGALILPVLAFFADVLPSWPSDKVGKLVVAGATILGQMAVISVVSRKISGKGPLERPRVWAITVTGISLAAYVVLLTMFTIVPPKGRIVSGFTYANPIAERMLAEKYNNDIEAAVEATGYRLEAIWTTGSLAVTRLSLWSTWIGLMAGLSYLIAVHVPHQKTAGAPQIDRRVFISYRRSDSAEVVGRIYDHLVERIDSANVFKDVDSIPLGGDFPSILRDAVDGADVALALIGPDWATAADDDGAPRIASDSDFVHIEVRSALELGVPIIPVLVRRATMPRAESYPPALAALKDRNGIQVRPDPDFKRDVDRILEAIAGYPSRRRPAPRE